MKHLRYLSYVLRHKWFVFIECCRLGIPWQGLIHDMSKFLPSEWFPYVEHFYGDKKKDINGDKFDYAWFLHQKRNPHHWQWWILQVGEGETHILLMPDKYCKEMVADWRGAGKAQGKPDTKAWYLGNKDKMLLHPDTRARIEARIL